MAAQHHIIKRQSIDLKIAGRLSANEIQESISQIYKDKLVHILNRYFDGLSDIEAVDRIDKLEIDLGEITADNLEFALEESLNAQLRLAKPNVVHRPKQVPEIDADEELSNSQLDTDLIVYFLQTGALPWWVRDNKQQAFTDAIHSLLKKDTTSVIAFFSNLLNDPIALKRLVYTADDQLLNFILTSVSPRYSAAMPASKQNPQDWNNLGADQQIRHLWWTAALSHSFGTALSKSKANAAFLHVYFNQLAIQERELLAKQNGGISSNLASFYRQNFALVETYVSLVDVGTTSDYHQQKENVRLIRQHLEEAVSVNSKVEIGSSLNVHVIFNKLRELFGIATVNYQQFGDNFKSASDTDKFTLDGTTGDHSSDGTVEEIPDKDVVKQLDYFLLTDTIKVQTLTDKNDNNINLPRGANNDNTTKTEPLETLNTVKDIFEAKQDHLSGLGKSEPDDVFNDLTSANTGEEKLDKTDPSQTPNNGKDAVNKNKHHLTGTSETVPSDALNDLGSDSDEGKIDKNNRPHAPKTGKETLDPQKRHLTESIGAQPGEAPNDLAHANKTAETSDKTAPVPTPNTGKDNSNTNKHHLSEFVEANPTETLNDLFPANGDEGNLDNTSPLPRPNTGRYNPDTEKHHLTGFGEANPSETLNDLFPANGDEGNFDNTSPLPTPNAEKDTSHTQKHRLTESGKGKEIATHSKDDPTFDSITGENNFAIQDPLQKSTIEKDTNETKERGSSQAKEQQQTNSNAHLGTLVSAFTDTDRLYIPNSGLVLFWPFLERFFSSIGLVEGGGFLDANSATKACLLLQYMAEGTEWARFEPNLPLNKLLCGLELYEPIDVTVQLLDDDLAAADHLVEALLGNAPLWKTLSADGLRSAYLQRDGVLSSRDGRWLLQVQRQTYDILLDRLPWTINTIKLPWMNNLIFVEWQQS